MKDKTLLISEAGCLAPVDKGWVVEDWSQILYIGEGNANLVVALHNKDVIIRFPKSQENEEATCLEHKLKSIIAYIEKTLRPLLGDRFLLPFTGILALSPAHLQQIRELIQHQRPCKRIDSNIFFPMGLIMPDLTRKSTHFPSLHITEPSIAIELKPKLGNIIEGSCPHPTLCIFCLKKYYKNRCGDSWSESRYCPLDLFSGQEDRIQKSIFALLDSPQNNIRIFGDGMLLHDETTTRTEQCTAFLNTKVGCGDAGLVSLLVTALTSPFFPTAKLVAKKDDVKLREDRKNLEHVCGRHLNIINNELRSGGKTSDIIITSGCDKSRSGDIIDINKGFADPSQGSILESVLNLQKINKLSDHQVKDIVEKLCSQGYSADQINNFIIHHQYQDFPFKDDLMLLRDYMVHKTAQDLSIFIMFVKCDSKIETQQSHPTIQLGPDKYIFSIKVIDLDPKHIGKISNTILKKQKWLNSCPK